MKILLANKFYYPRGGDCVYTISLEKLLKEKGHDVAVFSMEHPSNLPSSYSEYFPSHIDFNKRSIKSLISLLVRPFGASEVRESFTRLINDFQPDLVHLNNIHSQLSPILALICYRKRIPVFWTLHDYKLVCPAYLLLNKGQPCESCLKNRWSVITKRCIKNSLSASLVAYWEARIWNLTKLFKVTDFFIAPSNFLKSKMLIAGANPEKIAVMHNFVDISHNNKKVQADKDYYCYIGRLNIEKGLKTLLNVASKLPDYKLKVIGTGPLEEELISGNRLSNVEYLGFRTGEELNSIISNSRFVIVPSEVYENNPLIIIEALSLGVPVLGSNLGGISELIKPYVNGLLFEAGNQMDMCDKIVYMWHNEGSLNRESIAEAARRAYNSDSYYTRLIQLYNGVII